MSLATGMVIGGLVFGGGLGLKGCSTSPKFRIGECVRGIDSFGEFDSDFVKNITAINRTHYKYQVWSPTSGYFTVSTLDISILDKFNKAVDCP